MIRLLIYALIFLIVTVYLALIAKEDPGYALLSHGNWSIEGTLVLFLTVLTLAISAVLSFVYFLLKTLQVSGSLGQWSKNRQLQQLQKTCNQGSVALMEGRYQEAEKALHKCTRAKGMPLIHYLSAARAAHAHQDRDKRDHYLDKARKIYPEYHLAIGLTQVELLLKADQSEQALAILITLESDYPKHPQRLKYLFQCYWQQHDWPELAQLLPDIKKQQVFSHQKLYPLEVQIHQQQMQQAVAERSPEQLLHIWQQVPKAMQQTPAMVVFYCQQLLALKQSESAIKQIKNTLKKHWQADLILLYGQIRDKNPGKQLKIAETWLGDNGPSAALLLTLGRLCKTNELWGKAQDYLQKSIAIEPCQEAWQELGQLYEQQLDDTLAAMECYREGLALAKAEKPANPMSISTDLKP